MVRQHRERGMAREGCQQCCDSEESHPTSRREAIEPQLSSVTNRYERQKNRAEAFPSPRAGRLTSEKFWG